VNRGQSQQVFSGTGVFIKSSPAHRPAAVIEEGDGVSLNFVDTDIAEVVAAALGDILGLNYVIDPNVTGSITVQTNRPLPPEHLLATLESILALSGAAIIESDELYKVVPLAAARRAGVPVRTLPQITALNRGFNVQIVPLQYVPAAEMGKILESVINKENLLHVDELRNLLILAGTQNELKGVAEIIDIFDVDWMTGMSFGLFSLRFTNATVVAEELAKIFGQDRQEGLADLVRIEPIERLNTLLVVAQQPRYLKHAQTWIERLDQANYGTERRVFVYFVKNARAESLATALTEIFSTERDSDTRPVELAPGLQPVQVGSPETEAPSQAAEADSDTSPDAAPPAQAPPSAPLANSGISLTENIQAKIIPDADHNALIILATPREYQMIEATLQKLDIVPLQVLIEATIFEVTLNDTLQYGVQWFFRKSTDNSDHIVEFITSGVAPAVPGFSYFFSGNNVDVVLNALSEVTDVKMVAAPQLMVLDNQSARIQVGDQVPIATQSAVSITDSEAPVVNSIQFRDTGVILNVSPRVNVGGLVTLEVTQEVSSAIPTSTSSLSSPTIQQRSIESTVAVRSGDTVALGGLIEESKTEGVTGVPLLSEIPILGNLFKTTSETSFRTELLVLITPRVVQNQFEAIRVTDELRRRMGRVQQYILEYESTQFSPLSDQEEQQSVPADYGAAAQQEDPAISQAADEKPKSSTKIQTARQSLQTVDQTGPTDRTPSSAANVSAVQTPQFVVHLTSSRTEANAIIEWQRLSQLLPSLLGKLTPYIHRTEIEGLGTYYRLKAGPIENRSSARKLCRELMTREQYCNIMTLEIAQSSTD
jgi:general secretion pathway protein D